LSFPIHVSVGGQGKGVRKLIRISEIIVRIEVIINKVGKEIIIRKGK
jgi:hypothetical protein